MLQPVAISKLSSEKGLDESLLLHVLNVAWSSTRCEVEGHPVEFGFVIGNIDSIRHAIPGFSLHGPKLEYKKFTAAQILRSYAGLHKWNRVAIVIDRESRKIEGTIDLSMLKLDDPYEFISGITDCVCVVVKQAFSVRIYYNGSFQIQYIFNRKSGVIEERIPKSFLPLLEKQKIKRNVARRILDVGLRVSEMRKGGSFIIGPLTDLQKLLVRGLSRGYASERIVDLPISKIISYVTKDGCTWLDKRGLLIGYGLRFVGPGGRFAIAQSICSKTQATIAVVISQDGEINLIHRNKIQRFASQIASDDLFIERSGI